MNHTILHGLRGHNDLHTAVVYTHTLLRSSRPSYRCSVDCYCAWPRDCWNRR